MNIDQEQYDEIARMIHSDTSPVGIDAKKTHILIIHMLQDLGARLKRVEDRVDALTEK